MVALFACLPVWAAAALVILFVGWDECGYGYKEVWRERLFLTCVAALWPVWMPPTALLLIYWRLTEKKP